jgi:hypothetical protein
MRGLLLFACFFFFHAAVAHAQCCPPDTDVLDITQEAYRIDSALNTADAQVFNIDSVCLPYTDTFPAPDEARYYHLIPLQVNADDFVAIYTADSGIGADLFFALYQGDYNPNDPCLNLVGVSNLAPTPNNDLRLASLLKSEIPYQLLITTSQPSVTGAYAIHIATATDSTVVMTSDGSLTSTIDPATNLGPLPKDSATYTLPLYCSDRVYLFNNAIALFGNPLEQPGCGDIQNVSQQVEDIPNGDCGGRRIRRTISFDGPNGASAQCIQRIFMKIIDATPQAEIWLPPSNMSISGDQVMSLQSNGYPSPEVTGYPFMWTVDGIRFLDNELCNVGATMNDDSLPTGDCEDSYSFTRTWIILNWCDPVNFYTFNQHITVHTALPTIHCEPLSLQLFPSDSDNDGIPDTVIYELFASDFISAPTVSCGDSIYYSINRSGEAPNPDQTSITLGCEDIGTIPIEIWAYDTLGNANSCETFVILQDDLGYCSIYDPFVISSFITTEDDEGIANVEVIFTSGGLADTTYTDSTGSYGIPAGFIIDSTLTIEPTKDYDYLNGVSTFDLVLISKHILGTDPLDSPYKMIAADINNSGNISTLDIIRLQRLILGLTSEFSNNTSWRFWNPTFVINDPSNPWAGFDTLNISQPLWPANFIGIKIGDVNNSADASNLQQDSDEVVVRNNTPLYLHADAQQLQAGQSYNIPIFANQLTDIDGFQATLQANPNLELIGIDGGLMSTDNFGPIQPNGTLAMSWVAPQQLPAEKLPLFTLNVKAKAPTTLEKALSINAALLQPEAYGKDGSWSSVAFRFDAPAIISEVPLLRDNYPNPFRESTQIDFYLPADSPARLSVHNAIGQLIYSVELTGTAGWNTSSLEQALPENATGVLHYTLEVGEHRLTKRMLRLR